MSNLISSGVSPDPPRSPRVDVDAWMTSNSSSAVSITSLHDNPEDPQRLPCSGTIDLLRSHSSEQTYSVEISQRGSWERLGIGSPHRPRTNAHWSGESSGAIELCWLRHVLRQRQRQSLPITASASCVLRSTIDRARRVRSRPASHGSSKMKSREAYRGWCRNFCL